MKILIILLLLSSCTTQYYKVHSKTELYKPYPTSKEYRYKYTLTKIPSKDTLYMKTDFNYKLKDTIKL